MINVQVGGAVGVDDPLVDSFLCLFDALHDVQQRTTIHCIVNAIVFAFPCEAEDLGRQRCRIIPGLRMFDTATLALANAIRHGYGKNAVAPVDVPFYGAAHSNGLIVRVSNDDECGPADFVHLRLFLILAKLPFGVQEVQSISAARELRRLDPSAMPVLRHKNAPKGIVFVMMAVQMAVPFLPDGIGMK